MEGANRMFATETPNPSLSVAQNLKDFEQGSVCYNQNKVSNMITIIRKCLFVVLLLLTSQSAFTQNKEVKNWFSMELAFFGASTRYERMLNRNFSIGALLAHEFFMLKHYGVQASGRWYPWGGKFYTELDIGYGYGHYQAHLHDDEDCYTGNVTFSGARITPAVGWKIDFGKPGGFFINPMFDFPFVAGIKKIKKYGTYINDGEFVIEMLPRFTSIGFGYSF